MADLPSSKPASDDDTPPTARAADSPLQQSAASAAVAERMSPAQPASILAETPAAPAPQPQSQPSVAVPAGGAAAEGPRPDYGWLQQAVLRRLEELKRSSRPVLHDASPLKVLIKAVVSNEGELMETSVAKSSGLDRIDREAMWLVQRAFPMVLDGVIDRPQIVMRIPITYSRN
jgi:periplasmic protein TonB